MKKPYAQSEEAILQHLETTPQGLTTQQAEERRKVYGRNKLDEPPKVTLLQRFLQQLKDPMLIILMIAAAVSAATTVIHNMQNPEHPEGLAEVFIILIVVLLNAILGVVQESKAEKALDALKNMSALHAKVVRDGIETVIDAASLVPGDIIRLEAGDFVPADARLILNSSLKSEESALTGESVPSEKDADALVLENAPLGDRSNMVFSGCSITYGSATAVVTATGMNTEMGKIAGLLDNEEDSQTPLQKKLAQLGKYLGVLALAACAIIFVVGLLNNLNPMCSFLSIILFK